jgi:hypothetical protein
MSRMKLFFLLVLCAFALHSEGCASLLGMTPGSREPFSERRVYQAIITVTDARTGLPLAGAVVEVRATGFGDAGVRTSATDVDGQALASLTYDPSSNALVREIGYPKSFQVIVKLKDYKTHLGTVPAEEFAFGRKRQMSSAPHAVAMTPEGP